MGEISGSHQQPWREDVEIEGKKINFNVYSGTDMSVIGDAAYCKYINNILLRNTNKRLLSPCQNPLKILGVINIEINLKDKSCKEDLFFIKNLQMPPLSRSASTISGEDG